MKLDDGYLTIQAVRSHSNDEKDKKGRYLRRESFSGTCARSFYVGDVKTVSYTHLDVYKRQGMHFAMRSLWAATATP